MPVSSVKTLAWKTGTSGAATRGIGSSLSERVVFSMQLPDGPLTGPFHSDAAQVAMRRQLAIIKASAAPFQEVSMKTQLALAVLVLASFGLPAAAQTDHKVFTSRNINESAVVDALTPPPKTRSFQREGISAPAKPPSASVLITFETNSATLKPEAKHSLDVVGHALSTDKLARFKFSIEGHADPRGTADLNQRLSEERAGAVRQYLVQNQNIEASRLQSVGKGDKEPLNLNDPAAPENRRVTIVTLTQ